MISNTVASNGFLIVSVTFQAMTTVALGEPCALSIPSLCGQAFLVLGLGFAWNSRTNSVLGSMKTVLIKDLSSVVLVAFHGLLRRSCRAALNATDYLSFAYEFRAC